MRLELFGRWGSEDVCRDCGSKLGNHWCSDPSLGINNVDDMVNYAYDSIQGKWAYWSKIRIIDDDNTVWFEHDLQQVDYDYTS